MDSLVRKWAFEESSYDLHVCATCLGCRAGATRKTMGEAMRDTQHKLNCPFALEDAADEAVTNG